MKIYIIIFVFALVLQILDIISTYKALQKPGVYEANKLMKFLMEKMGILPALIFLKGFIAAVICLALYFSPDYRSGIAIGIGGASIFYIFVVYKNFKLAP